MTVTNSLLYSYYNKDKVKIYSISYTVDGVELESQVRQRLAMFLLSKRLYANIIANHRIKYDKEDIRR